MVVLFLLIVFLALIACLSGAIAIKFLNDSRKETNELKESDRSLIESKQGEEFKSFQDEDGKTPLERVFEENKG